jgi:hypothetical protein
MIDPEMMIGLTAAGGSAALGSVWWFRRWARSIDAALAEISKTLRDIDKRTAVAESRIADIETLRERVTIVEQKAKAAHSRLDGR